MRNPSGQPFTIVELPMPAPVIFDGQRLPASYANFYIANAAVLVPVFNDANDVKALKIIEQCFPRPACGTRLLPRSGVGSWHPALPDPTGTVVKPPMASAVFLMQAHNRCWHTCYHTNRRYHRRLYNEHMPSADLQGIMPPL